MTPLSSWLWDIPALVYQLALLLAMSPRCQTRQGREVSYDAERRRWSPCKDGNAGRVVLVVPGGGWQSNDDERHYHTLAQSLAQMGWTTAVADYPRQTTRVATRFALQLATLVAPGLLIALLYATGVAYMWLRQDRTVFIACSVASAAAAFAVVWVNAVLIRQLTSDTTALSATTLDDQATAVRRAADALHRDLPDARLVVVAHECGALLARRALAASERPFELVALAGVFDLALAGGIGDLWRAPESVRQARTTEYDISLPPKCTRVWLATGRMCPASRQMQSDAFYCVCTTAKVPVKRVFNCGVGSIIHSVVHPHTLTFLLSVLAAKAD